MRGEMRSDRVGREIAEAASGYAAHAAASMVILEHSTSFSKSSMLSLDHQTAIPTTNGPPIKPHVQPAYDTSPSGRKDSMLVCRPAETLQPIDAETAVP